MQLEVGNKAPADLLHTSYICIRICEFLSGEQQWRLREVSRTLRQLILGPQNEQASLLRCLRLCYGFWNPESMRCRSFRVGLLSEDFEITPLDKVGFYGVKMWLQLLILLELECRWHLFRAPATIELGRYEVKRVEDEKMDRLCYIHKFLCHSWSNGCVAQKLDTYTQDIAIYEIQDDLGLSAASLVAAAMKELTYQNLYSIRNRLGRPCGYLKNLDSWSFMSQTGPGPAMRLLYNDPDKHYLDIKDWLPHTELPDWYTPDWIMTPFLIRLLLEYSNVMARLVDVNDPLTPIEFLETVQQMHCFKEDPLLVYGLDLRDCLLKHPDVLLAEPLSFWHHPGRKWTKLASGNIDITPLVSAIEKGSGMTLDCQRVLRETFAIHQQTYMDILFQHITTKYAKQLVPFDMALYSKTELLPDGSVEAGEKENSQTAVVELSLSDSYNGPNALVATNGNRKDTCTLYISSQACCLLVHRKAPHPRVNLKYGGE